MSLCLFCDVHWSVQCPIGYCAIYIGPLIHTVSHGYCAIAIISLIHTVVSRLINKWYPFIGLSIQCPVVIVWSPLVCLSVQYPTVIMCYSLIYTVPIVIVCFDLYSAHSYWMLSTGSWMIRIIQCPMGHCTDEWVSYKISHRKVHLWKIKKKKNENKTKGMEHSFC